MLLPRRMITRALILAAGKGLSIGDGRRSELPRLGRWSQPARADARAARRGRHPEDRPDRRLRRRRDSAARRRVGAPRGRAQAARHLLREPRMGRAERAVGPGGARLRHRADAAGDGRSDRRPGPAARALRAAGRRGPDRAGGRSRSAARVRHRRRDEGEAGGRSRRRDRQGARALRRGQRRPVRDGAVALPGARAAAAAVADRGGGGCGARGAGRGARRRRQALAGRRFARRCACTPSGCCASTATSWRVRRCRPPLRTAPAPPERWRSSSACWPRRISPATSFSARARS